MSLHQSKRKTLKLFAGVAMAAALALPLSACSGSDDGEVVASIDNISGKTTAVKLDAGFVKALQKLKLTPGVVGGAKLKVGSLIFPITGGDVTYYKPGSIDPYVKGDIDHEGSGLTLAAKGTTVQLSNFTIDPGKSKLFGDVRVNGKTALNDAYIFALDGRTLKPLKTVQKTAILQGTKVKVSSAAAGLLNDTFKTKAVKPGLLVGRAKITLNTK